MEDKSFKYLQNQNQCGSLKYGHVDTKAHVRSQYEKSHNIHQTHKYDLFTYMCVHYENLHQYFMLKPLRQMQ